MAPRHGSALILALSLGACSAERTAAPAAPAEPWFTDEASASGLTFTHTNGMSGGYYIAELMAPGVALVDYDNDGDLDVYVTQGTMLTTGALPPGTGDRLFRNDLAAAGDESRTLRFTDVTDAAGIRARGYSMGVATGDIDNDGWIDLYVTRLGPNLLLRNTGRGTFEDISRQSGTDDASWSVSASFVDYDRDGLQDLYVGNYLAYSVASDTHCSSPTGQPDYCAPATYRPAADRLYRNRGGGRFEDVTARAGIARQTAPALGVLATDVNGDGWTDIYVANDAMPNLLWVNQRNGTFTDAALLSGVALSAEGRAEGSMGVDAGDVDHDGDEDLIVTNIAGEGHALYVNGGGGVFEDRSAAAALTVSSLPHTGFGAAWLDFDNDSWLDLLVANGHIHVPLPQRNQLFRNTRDGRFEDVTATAGPAFEPSGVGRGAAFGDIDNDGDTDVVIANNNAPLRLLVNRIGNRKHWVGLSLKAAGGTRDVPGARATITLADGSTRMKRVHTDGSYASASDPRLLFGVGDAASPVRVRVTWLGGKEETWDNIAPDRWTTLIEGDK